MNKVNINETAFQLGQQSASPVVYCTENHGTGERVVYDCISGLTKREAFAMAAMQGILAADDKRLIEGPEHLAAIAVEHADALLAELVR